MANSMDGQWVVLGRHGAVSGVLLAPHVHQLLRRHRGWSAERYRTWVQDAIIHELIG